MGYKTIEDRRAVKAHDEAIAAHDRAWNEMHEIGQELGRESVEYHDARRTVVTLRDDMTRARELVDERRRWVT